MLVETFAQNVSITSVKNCSEDAWDENNVLCDISPDHRNSVYCLCAYSVYGSRQSIHHVD